MTRNTALRLLALLLTALLFVSLVGDPALGYGALFVGWGLPSVASATCSSPFLVVAAAGTATQAAETCNGPSAPPSTGERYL